MSTKDILAIVISTAADEPALRAAELLAARFDGALAAAFLTDLPDEPVAYEPSVVAGVWAEMLGRARSDAEGEIAKLKARLAKTGKPWDVRRAEAMARDLGRVAAVHARYADIAVITRPGEKSEIEPGPRYDLVDGVLYHSGRPALVIPPDWKGETIGRKPLLAWDASREATRALSEADWLIEGAELVSVVTIDAKPKTFGHGEHPGVNIAAHLQRRGAKVEVRNLASGGKPAAEALNAEALRCGADLIVMGGYRHNRLQALMFGGATRDMLETAPIPLLMAH